jgi:hypothetical protein
MPPAPRSDTSSKRPLMTFLFSLLKVACCGGGVTGAEAGLSEGCAMTVASSLLDEGAITVASSLLDGGAITVASAFAVGAGLFLIASEPFLLPRLLSVAMRVL